MTPQPPPLFGTPPPTQWQVPPSTPAPESRLVPGLRARLVGLVAAMAIQATIAVLGVLPALPREPAGDASGRMFYAVQPVSFWAQFAVIELIAAVVISLAFGPGVRLRDIPTLGRAVLGLAFVVVPAAAIVLGSIDAAQAAAAFGTTVASSTWLSIAFFTTMFFGLPLLALGAEHRE